jgi:sulfide:quinone oxidoreductase
MARILVLGGGFGGISSALTLVSELGDAHEVTLVDDGPSFMMGLAKLWALDGRRSLAAGRRPRADLARHGVKVVEATVAGIDVAERTVQAGGKTLPWDRLIIALGARLAPEATPGFEAAHDLYDPHAVERLGRDLQSVKAGRVLFAVCGMPFKCPPAPYEAAMIAHSLLLRQGVRDHVTLTLSTPEPKPLPIAPDTCSGDLKEYLAQRDIAYHPSHRPIRIEAESREVVYENGARLGFDVLAAVPVHKAPRVVEAARLTGESGWIPVDAATLRTKHEDVYAVGDVTGLMTPSGKPLPKAGVFAEAQGRVVARNIARGLRGETPDARFDGRGYCFIETGDGRATKIEGDFFASPPSLVLEAPSETAYDAKRRFEAERLAAWFGA